MNTKSDLGTLVLDYADAEFGGRSFNGKSLMATLRSLDAPAAAAMTTHEGYSAWETLIHVAYCKYLIASELDALLVGAGQPARAAAMEPYPWEKTLEIFAPSPVDTSAAAWAKALDYLELVHKVSMSIIRSAGPEQLGATMSAWGIPFGQAIAWLMSHDAYHLGQLRSMGVPGLKEKKLAKA